MVRLRRTPRFIPRFGLLSRQWCVVVIRIRGLLVRRRGERPMANRAERQRGMAISHHHQRRRLPALPLRHRPERRPTPGTPRRGNNSARLPELVALCLHSRQDQPTTDSRRARPRTRREGRGEQRTLRLVRTSRTGQWNRPARTGAVFPRLQLGRRCRRDGSDPTVALAFARRPGSRSRVRDQLQRRRFQLPPSAHGVPTRRDARPARPRHRATSTRLRRVLLPSSPKGDAPVHPCTARTRRDEGLQAVASALA